MAPPAEQDFEAFRDRGDPRALARVFDALAPELLLVAAHLAADRAGAEDLVQETFLQAIESASAYRPGLPLRPWLIGILVRKAKMARRKADRQPDPARLAGRPQSPDADPAREAEAGELAASLAAAIGGMPAPYRQVLNLHLVHGHTAVEIARILERPPATVHTQLRRGLEMLRKALPVGLAVGPVATVSGRGLAAVREVVVQAGHAAALGGAGAAAGAVGGAFGGMVMMKKLLVVGSVAGLALLAWWQMPGVPSGSPPRDETAAAPGPMTGDLPGAEPSDGVAARTPLAVPGAGDGPVGDAAGQALLRGTVVESGGRPIAGAEVRLQRRSARGITSLDLAYNAEVQDLDRTATDDEGRFSFVVPPYRQFQVRADSDGFASRTVVDCRVGQDHVIELQPAGVLHGVITRVGEHSPVADARVELIDGNEAKRTTTTDARGRYRFEGAVGEMRVSVYPPHDVLVFSRPVTIEPGAELRLDLQVERGAVLRGTVVDDATGQPIPGAEVGIGWTFGKSVFTDDLGRFVMRGFSRRGYVSASVRAAGYGRSERQFPRDEGGDTVIEFRLTTSGAVRGRVLDAGGMGKAGVYVAAVAYEQDGPVSSRHDWQSARTQGDGRYAIEDLRTDLDHALLVRSPGQGMLVYDLPRNPLPGEVLELADVVVRPGASIYGTVIDESGQGVPEARVVLSGHNRDRYRLLPEGTPARTSRVDLYLAKRETVTGSDGAFAFADLSPGSFRMRAYFEGRWTSYQELDIEGWGEVLEGLQFTVERGLSITGRVVTPQGDALQEAIIEAYGADGSRGPSTVLRNDSGAFELKGVRPGTYTLEAMLINGSDGGWIGSRVTGIPAGATGVRIVLQRPEVIEGIVQDLEGRPIAGQSVMARVLESLRPRSRGPVRTGVDGSFRLRVGAGEVVNLHVGPERDGPRIVPDQILSPDPDRATVVENVVAGTRGMVIRIR